MSRYLKLVNLEFNRIAKMFFSLIGLTFMIQIAGVIVTSKRYLSDANHAMNEELLTKAKFLAESGSMSMIDVARSFWFIGPIVLCAAAIVPYIFMIWYRDWLGKNTFAYRLLTLPTARLNVFFAKITTILFLTFAFMAFQLIVLPIEQNILKWMVPKGFYTHMDVEAIIGGLGPLSMIIPNSIIGFIIYYAVVFMAIAILFTVILFERSYHIKGIFMGIGYICLAIIIFISPLLVQSFLLQDFFYTAELFTLMTATGLIVLFGSLWISRRLLNKKITV